LSLLAPLAVAAAQKPDSLLPQRGAWGAELVATSSGGSMLRFTSPRSAWLAGLSFSATHQDRPASGQDLGFDVGTKFVSAQLGHRWYLSAPDGETAGHLRPTLGVGALGTTGRSDSGEQFQKSWAAGGYGE